MKINDGFAYLYVDYSAEAAEQQQLASQLQKQFQNAMVVLAEQSQTNVLILSGEKKADEVGRVIESEGKYEGKLGKCGGNLQRRQILIQKKVKKEEIEKWFQ